MGEIEDLPATGYVVIRCQDRCIVARMGNFPVYDRAVMYRKGSLISFMPLNNEDIIGTPTLFTQMLEKAGYRVTRISSQSDMLS